MDPKKKIMIIDDEVDLAQMYKMRFNASGYDVSVLNSGVRALEKIKEERPDLILLDIMMPHKDGYILRDEIKSDDQTKDIPIIILSAKQMEHEINKDAGIFHDVQGTILKPVPPEFLVKQIEKYLAPKK